MENSSLFNNVYNPDVLSCIANLSNDEVFTPPELANNIIDMLPQELFENPDTTFIWAHAGTSAEIHRYQERVRDLYDIVAALLAENDNLYIDLSWTVLETYLLDDGEPHADWVALAEQYPGRFMIGTDLVGRFGNLAENIRSFDVFLDALSDETADRVARTNLLALLPKS